MRTSMFLAAVLAVGALGAQSLTTTFAGGNGLGTGGTTYFDLNAKIGLGLTAMDCNLGTAGVATTINVWVIPGTYVGFDNSSAGWTLAASATATANATGTPTNFTFVAPIIMSPGTYGFAIEHVGAGPTYTNGTAAGALFASNSELDFFEGGSGNLFTGVVNSPRVFNGTFYYTAGASFATSAPYGTGCGGVSQFSSYYESFGVGTFDLGGSPGAETVLNHINGGQGYVVLPGSSAWFTPVAPDLGLLDDNVSAAQPLGFTATMPNGLNVTDLYISSNGFVWLAPNTNSDLSSTPAELVAQDPRIAMYWRDLRPASATTPGTGTIHFDTDPANGVAYVTFVGVEEYNNPAALIDMQLALYSSGNFELRYGSETMSTSGTSTAPSLVGFSPGLGALEPPASDLSTVSGNPIFTMPDLFVSNMSLVTDRPVEGSSMNAVVSGIPASTVLGTLVLSATKLFPGVQPVPGLGSCFQYVGLDDVFYYFPTSSTATIAYQIPASGFTGFVVQMQAVTLSPGVNPLGVASSNAVTLTVNPN